MRRRYVVEYTCALDPGCPVFRTIIRAHSREDAEDQFFDCEDPDWKILSMKEAA